MTDDVVGLDIGYSNLCVVHGPATAPVAISKPACAGPTSLLTELVHGGQMMGTAIDIIKDHLAANSFEVVSEWNATARAEGGLGHSGRA